jgi:agmatinase
MSNFIGFDKPFEESKVVLFGIPFDGTTSFRPGTRFGPQAARTESFGIESYSPYLDLDLEDYNFCDLGDIDLPFGNTPRVLDDIYEFANDIMVNGKKPLMIGGEHLVTYPVFQSVLEAHPDVVVIHFDAHTDLRDDYMGEKMSHATVIKRVWDLVGDDRIFQFGIRSGMKQEFEWAKTHTHLEKFKADTLSAIIEKIKDRPVYLTIDLDVLDPSVFSGTGTPEPGGLTFREFMVAIVAMKDLNLIGADVVELSPHYDHSGVSTAVACKVIREVALLLVK